MAARVLGVLAGRDVPLETLGAWARSADIVLAADSGANRLFELGVRPHLLAGDLDSVHADAVTAAHEVLRSEDQSTTDTEKLLAAALARGFEGVTLIGLEGDRLDHLLANVLLAARTRRPTIRLALRRGLGFVLADGQIHEVSCRPGDRFSLIPIVPCAGVTIEGARWPLHNAVLEPLGPISISNEASSPDLALTVQTGVALLVLERPLGAEPTW